MTFSFLNDLIWLRLFRMNNKDIFIFIRYRPVNVKSHPCLFPQVFVMWQFFKNFDYLFDQQKLLVVYIQAEILSQLFDDGFIEVRSYCCVNLRVVNLFEKVLRADDFNIRLLVFGPDDLVINLAVKVLVNTRVWIEEIVS